MLGPSKQRITGRKTVWQHATQPFRVDELTVESEASKPPPWVSFERGDSVAALILNTDTDQIILVKQFRPPIAGIEGASHELVETVAGMIRQNEQPLQALQREIMEETGYQIAANPETGGLHRTEEICRFYTTPGGSSERVFLYYVEVAGKSPELEGGGVRQQGEEIRLELMKRTEFFEALDRGEFKDPKVILAGQWLEKRWRNLRKPSAGPATSAITDKQEFQISDDVDVRGLPRNSPRIIGYYANIDIGKIEDVDVWANSSNTEFLMDHVYHGSLSARIRLLGARRSGDTMIEDTIQSALSRRLAMGRGTELGNVIDTHPGALLRSNKVRRLIHVASVKGRIVENKMSPIAELGDLKKCVWNALAKCDELNKSARRLFRTPYRSVLLPLFGGGLDRRSEKLTTQAICDALIPTAIRYLKEHPRSRLQKVYFLAYTAIEVETCDRVMARSGELLRVHLQSDLAQSPSHTSAAPGTRGTASD